MNFLQSGCLLQEDAAYCLGWGIPKRVPEPQACDFQKTGPIVYAPDFFLEDSHPWWIFPSFQRVRRSEFVAELKSYLAANRETVASQRAAFELNWHGPDWNLFQTQFLDLQRAFKKGPLKKAVPMVFETTQWQVQVFQLASWMSHLLDKTDQVPVTLFGVWNSKEGILGASPELLFERTRPSFGSLQTAALAGTRFHQSSRPLLDDPKELQEHRMVIDGICRSLEGFGKVSCEETGELVLPFLSHLLTPISVELDDCHRQQSPVQLFLELIQSLHPTPALGGYPREAGALWFQSCRNSQKRLRSGAPFGFLKDDGTMRCLVNIRNIQWHESTVYVGAGCGVIAESVMAHEWAELLAKIESIKRIFGMEVH